MAGDYVIAPNEFLYQFPGTIVLHIRKNAIPRTLIRCYVLHKGMLDRVDPEILADALVLTPVLANKTFVIFSDRGARIGTDRIQHLEPLLRRSESVQPFSRVCNTAIVVPTYNRPWALQRTLRSLVRHRLPIVVIDDGSTVISRWRNRLICTTFGATYVGCPINLGLANALNIGVCHWLSQPQINWISVLTTTLTQRRCLRDLARSRARQSPTQ